MRKTNSMKLAGRLAFLAPLLLSSPALLPQASAQGRQAATPTPAAQTPAAVPGGRGGRGGVAGPGPAIGGEIDETPVVTHHSVTVQGKTINYTATVAQMPLKDASGETEAHIFYMAYTLDGVTDTAKRPLTFCFNGGPGSASMWVHMGGMGPRSPKLVPNGSMPPPPYQMKDNQNTWLDQTDLVFIDPVGTGYSRAKSIEVARRMNGVQGDIQSVGEFMRMYVARNNRQLSPLFIAGESYGTFRAAGLAGYLIDRGMAFNGIVLIGTTLNLETIWSRSDDLVYQLLVAHTCRRCLVSQEGSGGFAAEGSEIVPQGSGRVCDGRVCDRARQRRRDLPPPNGRRSSTNWCAIRGWRRGISTRPICASTSATSRASCCATKGSTIGRYDGRLTGPSGLNVGETSEFDPSSTLITPPFTAVFTNYMRTRVGVQDRHVLLPERRHSALGLRCAERLRRYHRHAAQRNGEEPVHEGDGGGGLLRHGDAVLCREHTFNHMGLNPEMHKSISWDFYQSGHMLYIDSDSHAKLKHDFGEFVSSAIGDRKTTIN